MGMTDRQFDSYQASIVELLKEAREEVVQIAGDHACKKLSKLIERLEAEFKRP